MRGTLDRRALLASFAALGASPASAFAKPRAMRVTLLGQSLIQQDLCRPGWPGMAAIARRLKAADVVFTDLETAIEVPGAIATRVGEVLHAAPVAVIDCLKALGVTAVTTANNHAWDLGGEGILAAINELDRRGIVHSGTGRDLAAASAAAVQSTPAGKFILVSAAAGAIRDGGAATAARPGVNELRRTAAGALDPRDVGRTLDTIRSARVGSATVLMCLHNHYWEPSQSDTPDWQKAFARACVDAGASAFVAHGTPLMQGWERYNRAPLFHGLGNFIFQTRKADDFYKAPTWRSLMVEADFVDGVFAGARMLPVLLDAKKHGGEFSRGTPSLAKEKALRL